MYRYSAKIERVCITILMSHLRVILRISFLNSLHIPTLCLYLFKYFFVSVFYSLFTVSVVSTTLPLPSLTALLPIAVYIPCSVVIHNTELLMLLRKCLMCCWLCLWYAVACSGGHGKCGVVGQLWRVVVLMVTLINTAVLGYNWTTLFGCVALCLRRMFPVGIDACSH